MSAPSVPNSLAPSRPRPRTRLWLVLFLAGLAVAALWLARRQALRVVTLGCAGVEAVTGTSWPCERMVTTPEGRRMVVLRAPLEPLHVLAVPTAGIVGLESADLAGPVGADYLQGAWTVRAAAAPPGTTAGWADMGLAINGPWARTQDQLHLHVECLTPRARDAFSALRNAPTDRWTPVEDHRRAWVKRWPHADLQDLDFRRELYRAQVSGTSVDPARINLGVAGIAGPRGEPEFLLIYGVGQSLERFLDPECGLLRR